MARSVLIVGAGPAGMAAAIAAAQRSAAVTVVDEAPRPGGQIYRQAHPDLAGRDVADPAELARKRALLDAFAQVRDRIDYRPNTAAFALFPGEAHLLRDERTEIVRADAIVLAAGVREIALPFPGWTIPGVMYAGGAQSLIKAQRVLPGRRVVVAGAGPLPVVVAAQILRSGGPVAALAMLNPLTAAAWNFAGLLRGRELVVEGLRYLATVLRARVPRLPGYVPVEALGREQVEAVVLAQVNSEGRIVPGTEREIACDALAINYGFSANSELAAMAGADMRFDRPRGGWLPAADELGRTSIPGLLVAGDAAGLRGALVAEAEGGLVGVVAASDPSEVDCPDFALGLGDTMATRRRLCAFQTAVQAMLRVPAGLHRLANDDTTICRCENVRLGDLRHAFSAGHLAPNTLKRATRAGMGWCGGRTCMPIIAALAELHGNAEAAAMMTPRPLARPVSLAALANQARP